MPTMADTDVDGIVAFLKKSDAKGHSVYEQLASVVQQVRPPRPPGGTCHARAGGHSPSGRVRGADARGRPAQIVEEKPEGAVDLLETSLLQKATAFDYADTAPQHLGTQLANFWGEVARRFRGNDGVIALELLNEP